MNMIKLTIFEKDDYLKALPANGKPVYINTDSIEAILSGYQEKKVENTVSFGNKKKTRKVVDKCSVISLESGKRVIVQESVEEIYSLISNKENMQTLKRKVVILNNINKQLAYNKLKLVKLRKFCSGEGMKEAKDYVDGLDFKHILLRVNVKLASEEFILQKIKEIGLNEYFMEIREEN